MRSSQLLSRFILLALHIPHLAWTFHDNCPPNLLVDTGSCGADATLEPTSWGSLLRDRLAQPW